MGGDGAESGRARHVGGGEGEGGRGGGGNVSVAAGLILQGKQSRRDTDTTSSWRSLKTNLDVIH